MTKGQKVVNDKTPPSVDKEPRITHSRYVTLHAPDSRLVNLGHLRSLAREADERGFATDAHVDVLRMGMAFGESEVIITVGGQGQ